MSHKRSGNDCSLNIAQHNILNWNQ